MAKYAIDCNVQLFVKMLCSLRRPIVIESMHPCVFCDMEAQIDTCVQRLGGYINQCTSRLDNNSHIMGKILA